MFLRAWTVVLRYYVGSDMICFGQIDDTAKASPRFTLCHGDIAVNASLKELEPSFEISEHAQISQSAADWMNANTSFNTLVWKSSQPESFSAINDLDTTKSAIVLLVSNSPQPQATLLYAPHLIGDPVASAVAEAVGYVASVFLDAPETTIGEIDLFGHSSWEQIQQWNRTVPDMVEECLHEQIDKTALTCPDKIALECWDGSMTYAQLVDYTNRVGNFLIDQNIRPSVFVPCCFDKSLWAAISMLGVLKAGGAFVCIDPAQPIDRLTTIIEEVDANFVLAAPEHCKMFAGTGCTPLAIDADFIYSLPPCHGLPRRATPKDPLLAIFTSGSTGKPKGIIHEHRAVCSSAKEHAVRLNINSDTRTFQFASFTFIINTFELFTPLLKGGCACIPSKEDRLGRTAGAMRDFKANWVCLTPSFVRSVKPEDIPDVKTLLLAGEPVQQDNLEMWRSHVRLLNMYGASEASVCVTGELSGSVDRSTIGTGTGVATWIVDPTDDDRLAPIGAIGELVVEGPVLAREYINQPEKTAASFISNTSWLQRIRDGAPTRAYKTGDLARYGSDGRINLVGRKDMQVKLRGQRIELEEVEFHLRQTLPKGIELVVGLVKPVDQPDRPFLAAFVALKKSLDAGFHQVDDTSSQLLDEATRGWKDQAANSLPGYMVPSTLVKLKHMPLTASGKTNRKAVSDYASQLTVAALTGAKKKEHKEPATPTGIVLRKLWAQVLDLPPEAISADDSFLELGGNSIDAMKLVNIARDEAMGLSVGEIFGHPTLDDMAAASWKLDAQEFEDVPFSLLDESIDTNDLIEKVAAQCKVSASAIEDLYPCTALQDGLMALSDSRDGAYIAQHTLALGKDIDVNRFKRACQQVVDAHPILRTRIVFSTESTSLQAVVRGDIDWQVGEKLKDFLQSDKERPMRSGDSLTRYGLVHEGVEWTFVWTVHHAVYDAWTLELVFDRLHKAYHGEPMAKDVTFKEFMSYVVNTSANASEEYWRNYLAGATQNEFPCTVSTAKQPVSDATFGYEMSIKSADQQSGITLASMIRAAWGILIGSHSEADDVVFGTIVSGRNAPVSNLDRLVGPGIAAVPVRVKIPDNSTLTVRDFVKRVQSEATESIAYEQAGLQNIRRVSPEASSACDFQTLLVVQPAKEPVLTSETPNLRAVSGANANFGTYALTLECSLKSNGVACAAHYDSSLVDGDYIRRILGQLEHLLQQICTSTAETKLNELTFISAQDQANIRQWNQDIPSQVNETIHGLIANRFTERPKSQAVCAWDGSFTYAELDRHSARLARRLAELGAGPETFIPCCFEKSRWSVAAMLGVLRSGSAFLNIDPSQPESRIQLMIRKLKGQTIVCSPEQYDLCTRVAEGRNIVILNEDTPEESTSEVTPIAQVSPDNAAYVIFTSGSTGEPKGTIIQHGAYCSGSITHAPAMLMDGDTRALQFASFTFDASLVEILTVLVVGGCVCMPSEEQRKRDVTEAFRATRANWAVLTPSFVNLIKPEDVPSLKTLGLAGEAMSRSHIETWGHRVRLINAYGPSECCVCSTSNVDVTLESDPRNIGRACSGASWVVMPNNHHRLVPIGSVGELVMEGWNVGRGYLNEPTKTQAAFVENPRWLFPDDNTRPPVVYKTGDLVRYNPDGTLSFLRRKDTQVKLRGQRVELGEIEYRIKQSLASKPDAVVDILTPKDAPDQPRLVAFLPITMEDGMGSSNALDQLLPPPSEQHLAAVAGLDDLLAEFLPMHMIPSAYLPVQYIPKLPSGKADRKTLIRCGSQLTHRQMAEYSGAVVDVRPPTTEMQCTLQRLWADCLKLPTAQISLNDNFLRLGGDSITAMRLASAARAQGIPLSTATVFQHPTLEAMSAIAETLAEQKLPQSFEAFSSVKSIPKDQLLNEIVLPQAKVPASSVQDVVESTDFQTLAINGGLNQTRGWSNYLVFDFDGPIDLRRLQVACEKLIAHHAILRTVFVTTGSQLLQVVLQSYKPEFTFHIQDEQDPSERLVREDLARPPHLGEPIVRFMLIKDGAVRHRLIMRVSHAQYDGASMPLLLQDLRLAYRGETLPKRPNFSDFVRMQLHVNQGAEDFYTKLLTGSAMTQFVSHKKMSTTNVLNTMIADMVPLVAFKNHGITAATVIKAAWALVLGEMAATTDVVYGHMVSGRNLQLDNVEAIMGPCLNIVPVRANMGIMKTILDLLQTIQQQQTDTIPHESLGFRQIIDKCTDWPAETRFSSVFQYQEFGGEDASQPLSIERTLKCAPGFICPAPDACDLSILATPVGEQVRIEMIFSNHSMSRSFAEGTMRKLCSKVELISRGVEAQLPTVTEVRDIRPSIPLAEPLVNGNVNSMVKNVVNGINSRGMNGAHETNGVGDEQEPMEEVNLLASVRIN
ncbi:predicted protein [Aspergillus terreus NIH2624]|uniref:Carrier domain-containing protein n=1 Tax=Aspergillus terreus (strain NIH 2624 / FGSC A1156) TaxID=341663 RepID=Q0CB70_ASPTN|nr:uncharacterized protein ATEG_09064 [Aspergillus terreus NIH2624]EAU30201.1 predicted protein [Aspergillus terreus NIH2624]